MDVFKGVFREEGWAMPLLGKFNLNIDLNKTVNRLFFNFQYYPSSLFAFFYSILLPAFVLGSNLRPGKLWLFFCRQTNRITRENNQMSFYMLFESYQ